MPSLTPYSDAEKSIYLSCFMFVLWNWHRGHGIEVEQVHHGGLHAKDVLLMAEVGKKSRNK